MYFSIAWFFFYDNSKIALMELNICFSLSPSKFLKNWKEIEDNLDDLKVLIPDNVFSGMYINIQFFPHLHSVTVWSIL